MGNITCLLYCVNTRLPCGYRHVVSLTINKVILFVPPQLYNSSRQVSRRYHFDKKLFRNTEVKVIFKVCEGRLWNFPNLLMKLMWKKVNDFLLISAGSGITYLCELLSEIF